MTIPVRCNRRSCHARRDLDKHPREYKHWPRCHMGGCVGRMYVDNYQINRGLYDLPATCRLDCKPYPHSVSSPDCKCHADYIIERSLRRRS